jgi:DNA-binding CsgD family transcriptional regulator
MNTLIDASHRSQSAVSYSEDKLSFHHQPVLLQGVLEGMMDGVLVLTDKGRLIYANPCAHQFCYQLIHRFLRPNLVPPQIWHTCRALIENWALFGDRSIVIEDEISTDEIGTIRIRVRWLDLHQDGCFYLLVTLEDRHQSAQNIAIAEARKYGLTERETEVWLLRRANYTYKAIATKLHIALDTVKKHVKSIHAKRQATQWEEE